MKTSAKDIYWFVLRVFMSFLLLWAFFDKLLGLGFSTTSQGAWINGGSPTTGFLKSLHGSFSSIFNPLAGNTVIDWLFMLGLLVIGLCFLFGIFIRSASVAGIVMFLLMWLAEFPVKTNPLVDEHILYVLVLIGFIIYNPARFLGLQKYLPWNRPEVTLKTTKESAKTKSKSK